MDELYETQISNGRWIVYDIPGNIGWIMYIVALILSVVEQPGFMEIPWVECRNIMLMLTGSILCFLFAGLLLREYKKLKMENGNEIRA